MSLSFDQREIFEGLSSIDIGSSVSVRGELEIITALTLKKLLNEIGKEHFYLMHLSWEGKDRQRLWDIAARKKLIGLDRYHPIDVNRRWEEFSERRKKQLTWKWHLQFELFAKMENDDCVVVMAGKKDMLGIALAKHPYMFKPEFSEFFRHVRRVEWLLNYDWQDRICFPLRAFPNTISYVDESSRYWQIVDRRIRLQRSVPHDTRVRASERTKRRRQQLQRKYGPSGEGPEHQKLKEWVFQNPHALGLTGVLRAHKEYEIPSGDRVDVVFDLLRDRYAVVEIETDNPTPGTYQALKYKVLKCAEIGLDVKSPDVEAILVAWSKPQDAYFCQKYGVRFVRKKL
jgi:hypothetical protein